MITARVAYDYLQEVAPEVLPKAEALLKPLQSWNIHEGEHSFVECATFADDIKDIGFAGISPYHYIDQPFFDHYNTTVLPEDFNVTWAITNMKKELMKKHHADEETEGTKRSFGDAFNLRLLIHYAGDMHQPLHTVSRYAKDFPNGDLGGNWFNLTEKDGINELHALWDSTVYEWDIDLPRPLSNESWDSLTNISLVLRTENQVNSTRMQADLAKPETEWASEGYELATTFVYNITQNTLPDDDYVKGGQKIVHYQLAKGGYRLAMLLMEVFKVTPKSTPWDVPSTAFTFPVFEGTFIPPVGFLNS